MRKSEPLQRHYPMFTKGNGQARKRNHHVCFPKLAMVVGDEVPMKPFILMSAAVGWVLLGVIGVQYSNIQTLHKDKEVLSASVSLLQQTNAQQILDIDAANLRYVESQAELEREREISSERETSQKQITHQLNQQLNKLRTEVSHDGEESKCMRARMPDYALRLLRGDSDDNSHEDGGKEGIPTR